MTRFYNAVVIPTANFAILWAARTGVLLGSVWLLVNLAGWLR